MANAAIRPCGKRSRMWISQKEEIMVAALSLIVGLGGCLWLGPLCVKAMRPVPDQIIDYYQDWGSARNHLVGLPVYTEHVISIPRHLGIPKNSWENVDYNAHPPASVLMALPLARLNYSNAVLAWNMISLAAFLASLVIVATALRVPTTFCLLALASLTSCHPLYGDLLKGQLTLILVLLVAAIWALERSGWSSTAGLLLGIAAGIKLFPAYLIVYYLARGRIRPLMAAALSFLVLNLVTAFVLGMDTYYDYISVVLPHQSKFRSFGYNLSIAGFWSKLFDPVGEGGCMTPLWPSPALARWGTLLSDLVITVIIATFAHRARTFAQRDLAFATVVTAMLLVSPVTWDFSLPLLLVPISVIASCAGKSRWMPAALLLILAVVWMPQIVWTKLALCGHSLAVAPWTFMLGAPSIKFYALLGIFSLGLAAFRTEQEEVMPGATT
jgi:alpha-1,2-mannosyltransferase